jgi:predicted PurR-regulated permease PerM
MSDGQGRANAPTKTDVWYASWWQSAGVFAGSLAGGLAMLAGLVLFARPLALLFVAVCIAAALSPLADRVAKRMPRGRAILLIYALLVLAFVIIAALLLTPLFAQVRQLYERLPELQTQLQNFLTQNGISSEQTNSLIGQLGDLGRGALRIPGTIFGGALEVILVVIVSLYLLLDAKKIGGFILSLFGSESRTRVNTLGLEMLQVAGGYVRGVVINMLLVGTITTIGLTIIGLPFALVLGILTGLAEALPVVGSLIAAVPTIVIGLLQSPTTALITIIFVIAVQQIQGNVIAPNVLEGQASVPRFIVPLAILAGGAIGGVLGALIVVPIIAVLRVFILRVVAPFIRRQTGAAKPAA